VVFIAIAIAIAIAIVVLERLKNRLKNRLIESVEKYPMTDLVIHRLWIELDTAFAARWSTAAPHSTSTTPSAAIRPCASRRCVW
jgi:hypothetical protein